MQRRALLKLGAVSAAVVTIGGGLAMLIQPGLTGEKLSDVGRQIFRSVGRGILDSSLPTDERGRESSLDGMLQRVDELVAALPVHAQSELSQLLSLLATTPGRLAVAGLTPPWQDASAAEVQSALQDMRFSTFALRQQAYAALHDITAGSYFAGPETWSLLGYPGPIEI